MTWFILQWSAFPELDAVLSVYLCLSSSVPLVSLVPLRPPSNFFIHSPSLPLPTRSIQYTSPKRRSLAECGCSLTLPLTTSIGIWHGAGATKSWPSVLSLICSWRIFLCNRFNHASGGWATRIIRFNLLVFSTVCITLIHQETISLAIRNHSFRLRIEDRLTFRDLSPVVIRAKRMHLSHRLFWKHMHQRSRKRSLLRKYRRRVFITAANTEGMRRWLWQASIPFSKLIQKSYPGSNPIYYPLPSLVQDTIRCCLEYICISDPMFECEWARNLFRWKLVDWWVRRGCFPCFNELRGRKCFDSGCNWLDERLEEYLIYVSHWHGWISLFNEFCLFSSEVDRRMWKIWSRDMKISYSASQDKFCACHSAVAKEVELGYWFCVFVWILL